MAKGGCREATGYSREEGYLFAEFGPDGRGVHLFRLGRVDGHVKEAEEKLTKVEKTGVHVFGLDESIHPILGDLFLGPGIMGGQVPKDLGIPTPILQHLRGSLDKITLNGCSMEPGPLGLGADLVHYMTQLVKIGGHFIMLQ